MLFSSPWNYFITHRDRASSVECYKTWLQYFITLHVAVSFIECWLTYCREPAISLHSHHVSLVAGLPVCFLSQGTRLQIPWGVLTWNWDSPVSVVLLHWWPWRDWSSLQPCLQRASSQTVTRPSCRQCDNPTWSHTAFLSRFHARCRSSFQLHNHEVGCWGEPYG